MSKFDLLSGIENPGKEQKKKYQIFKVQMGFESVQVCIPFESADEFFAVASKAKPKSATSLLKLAKEFGGTLHP